MKQNSPIRKFLLLVFIISLFPAILHAQEYCAVSSDILPNASNQISSFTTSGGYVNISNSQNTPSAYSNNTSQTVSQIAGGMVSFSAGLPNYSGFAVYIDWNNNFSFNDPGELVYGITDSEGPVSGSFTVPPGAPAGNYRLRLRSDSYSFDGPPPPCGSVLRGEAEDYTVVVTVPTCPAPVSLSVSIAATASFSWSAAGTTPSLGYEYVVSTSSALPASGTGTTATTIENYSLLPDTAYYLFVRANCGGGDYSQWSVFSFNSSYCAAGNQYSGAGFSISSFSTSTGYSNINNPDNGHSPYSNYSSMSVSHNPGEIVHFNATVVDTPYVTMFIDWNNNLSFNDPGELVYSQQNASGNISGSFTIPPGTPAGSHRMRLRAGYIYMPESCGNVIYGETEDYTVNVIAPPSVSQFEPIGVCEGGGVAITITGANFTGVTAVTFNGVDAASFEVIDSETIIAIVPDTATTGTIGVTTNALGTSGQPFHIYPYIELAPITGGNNLCGGAELQLSHETPGGTWNSLQPDIAAVNPATGLVTGLAEGSSVIVYTAAGCNNTVSTTVTVSGYLKIVASTGQQAISPGNSTVFTVAATGTGITYQWQYATTQNGIYTNVSDNTPAGITYSGATGAALTVNASAQTQAGNYYYRTIVTSGECSANSVPARLTVGTYCTPGSQYNYAEPIANFTIGNISNSSGYSDNVYENYSHLSANVTPSAVVPFSVTPYFGASSNVLLKVWVDWNNDFDFDDVGELVYSITTTSSPISGTITIPSNAVPGAHRLRVGTQSYYYSWSTQISPCYVQYGGAFEDYTINVLTAPVIANFNTGVYCEASKIITIQGSNLSNATLTIGGAAITPLTINSDTLITATVNAGVSGIVKVMTPGGSIQTTEEFTVAAAPDIVLSNSTLALCGEQASAVVTIISGAEAYDTFVWEPNIGVSGTAASGFTFNPSENTTYTLTATNAFGCSKTAAVTTTVNPEPTFTATPAAAQVCSGAAVLLSASATPVPATGGCLTASFGRYPNGIYNAQACDGVTVNTIVTDCFAGEYSRVNVIANTRYTFTSSGPGDYVTISNEAGTVVYAAGLSPLVYDNGVAGVIRFYSHTDPLCGESETERTRSFVCMPMFTATWSPTTGLYTNAGATTPYAGGQTAAVYAKPLITTDYSVTAVNDSGCTTTKVIKVTVGKQWTGATSSDWATASNWTCNEVPLITDDVTIPQTANQPIVSGDVTALGNNLTVDEGALVTVVSGNVLNIAGAVSANGEIVLENNAHLMQAGTTNTNTGAIEVHRNSSLLYRQDYTMWSSPVAGQGLRDFSAETLLNRFYTYNPVNNNFMGIFADAAAQDINFATGQGYLIRMPNGAPEAGYVAGTTSIIYDGIFTGTPNSGNISVAVIPAAGEVKGYNAIGNPYPSPISIPAFFAANGGKTDGTIYLWRRKNGSDIASAYCTINAVGEYVDNGQLETEDPNGFIQTGQGFIVKALSNTINFNNSMRSATTNHDGSFFRMNEPSTETANQAHRIWLNLSKENTAVAQMLVGYRSNATMGIDLGIDAPFINDVETGLNSVIDDKAYAIQGRSLPFDGQDIVPLQFKTNAAGSYSIAIDHVDGLFLGNQDIYLKDNLLNVTHDIKASGYNFSSDAGIFNDRFEIVYVTNALGTDEHKLDAKTIIVYKQNNNLVINSGFAVMANIKIFDTRGRLVYERNNINASETLITDLRAEEQMLIVQVTTVENAKVNKKIIY